MRFTSASHDPKQPLTPKKLHTLILCGFALHCKEEARKMQPEVEDGVASEGMSPLATPSSTSKCHTIWGRYLLRFEELLVASTQRIEHQIRARAGRGAGVERVLRRAIGK